MKRLLLAPNDFVGETMGAGDAYFDRARRALRLGGRTLVALIEAKRSGVRGETVLSRPPAPLCVGARARLTLRGARRAG